jgi:cytochrome c-type biogenesis protein CcmH
MRHEVRSRIAAGQSGDEVRAWLVERYGEYISYEPSIGRLTWPLYAIPFFIALLAGLVVWRRIARTPAGHA